MEKRRSLSVYSPKVSAIALIVFSTASLCLYGQETPMPPGEKAGENTKGSRDFTIRVAVEEVRLDAVVLDKKGRPISDLTADDFEIYQDKLPQKVLSCTYITNQTMPAGGPGLPRKKAPSVIPIPAPVPERDKVNRTIIFVVDDISMNFENIYYARMAMERFVQKQMQPGDLVAILRTGYGNSALQMFLSDKRQLLARIEKVRWGTNAGRDIEFDREHYNLSYVFDGQLSTIRYSLRALKNLPGRKVVILLSAHPVIPKPMYENVDEMFSGRDIDYYSQTVKAYNRLADEALRSGAVVHVMDVRGLMAPGIGYDVNRFYEDLRGGLNPLPLKTGGIFIQNSNFFVEGIGKELENMLKGYYLLSYAPPPTTFKADRKNIYHRVKIKVKRRGATVYTRDGFYGVAEEKEAPPADKNPLQEAIFSPFQNKDLKVSLASGYIADAEAGYVLRSWLHLDADEVTIKEKPGEGCFAEVETVCLTSDIDGRIHDLRILRYLFRIREENLSWIREHGIRFSLLLPVKKPGSYYLRAAVKDMASGKVGSAYQFIQIPDLKKNRLALSNIFVVNRKEDAEWIRSGMAKEPAETSFVPVLERDESRSPALRNYSPGDDFRHMIVVYNAKAKKKQQPDLEVQSILYKDGAEVFKNEFKPLLLNGVKNFDRILITQKLTLGSKLDEGDYVLQMLVRDKQRKKKDGLASQTLDFQIAPK
jgi:VWFA-related protein